MLMEVWTPVRHKTDSDATGRAGASPTSTMTRGPVIGSCHGRGYLSPPICGGTAFYRIHSYLSTIFAALTTAI
jgi:hypothetical protein